MFKRFWVNLAFGLIGGLFGAVLTLNYVGSDIILSSNEFNDQLKSQIASNIPSPSASPLDHWQDIVQKASTGTVAIQTFKNNRLLKEFSGIVTSSDGLVITTYDGTSGAQVVQVMTEDKISKGQVVAFDQVMNLALVRVSDNYSSVVDLSNKSPVTSGQEVILVGKIVESNKTSQFSQKGIISYVSDRSTVIDSEESDTVQGTKVYNVSNNFIGMAYVRSGKIYLVGNEILSSFLNNYLTNGSQ